MGDNELDRTWDSWVVKFGVSGVELLRTGTTLSTSRSGMLGTITTVGWPCSSPDLAQSQGNNNGDLRARGNQHDAE